MANDFDPVSKIIEYWRFENNLTAGKAGNDLSPSGSPPGYSSTDKKEGSYALDLVRASNQYAERTDTNLTSGFPFKNGDTDKIGTICFWVRPEILNAGNFYDLVSKGSWNPAQRSVSTYCYGTMLRAQWGYGTGSTFYDYDLRTLTVNRWYHVACAYDGVNKTLKCRIWDDSNSSASNYSFTPASAFFVGTGPFSVGRLSPSTTTCWDGKVDEIVVSDSLLSDSEIDSIRQGTFNQANPDTLGLALSMQRG